jgi:hypothetical protein
MLFDDGPKTDGLVYRESSAPPDQERWGASCCRCRWRKPMSYKNKEYATLAVKSHLRVAHKVILPKKPHIEERAN